MKKELCRIPKFLSGTASKTSRNAGSSGVPKGGGGWGFSPPPPEIPKILQNRAKLNPIVKTVKNS